MADQLALKDGTITQDQYDGLQREIVETEQKLKALEEQAKASGTALQEIAAKGEKLKTVGDNVTNVGKKFMPVTLGVVGLGTAAVKIILPRNRDFFYSQNLQTSYVLYIGKITIDHFLHRIDKCTEIDVGLF